MHRFSSRGAENAVLTRPATKGTARRTVRYVEEPECTRLRVGGTRFAGRAVRADGLGATVENLCIIRARKADRAQQGQGG